jgi:hypothetical protein
MKHEIPPFVLEDWWCQSHRVYARVTARNLNDEDAFCNELEINDANARESFLYAAHHALQSDGWSKADLRRALLSIRRQIQQQREAGEKGSSPPDDDHRSQTDKLLELAEIIELIHDAEQRAYALTTDRGHRECHPVHSRVFDFWLRHAFYKAHGKAPTAQAVKEALNTLEGKAQTDGEYHEVHVRVAHSRDGSFYLDLGDPDWRGIYVAPTGWEIMATPPVYFRRPKGMRALPEPERGGSLDELWDFVNVPDPDARALIEAWLAAALGSTGPYSVLAFCGEQGSAKSTLARMLRALADPAKPDLRSNPHEMRDLAIAAGSWRSITSPTSSPGSRTRSAACLQVVALRPVPCTPTMKKRYSTPKGRCS